MCQYTYFEVSVNFYFLSSSNLNMFRNMRFPGRRQSHLKQSLQKNPSAPRKFWDSVRKIQLHCIQHLLRKYKTEVQSAPPAREDPAELTDQNPSFDVIREHSTEQDQTMGYSFFFRRKSLWVKGMARSLLRI
jgi:hypothetical protein